METLAARLLDVTVDDHDSPIVGLNKEPLVPLEDALRSWQRLDLVDLDADDIEIVLDCAQSAAKKCKARNPADPLTEDQIAAIHVYTQESPVYHVLNTRMRDRDRKALKPAFPYLKLFLTALYSLTPVTHVTVYRGIRKDLSAKFKEGTDHRWWAFSSTTRKVKVLENPMFLGTSGPRTMLHITATTAYDISMYSAMDSEQELLLPPGTKLEVESNMSPAKDLYMVQMKQQPYRPLFTVDTAGAGAVVTKGGAAAAAASPAASLPSPPPPKGAAAPSPPKSAAAPPATPPAAAAKAAAKPVHAEVARAVEEIKKGQRVINLNSAVIGDDGVCALVDFLVTTNTRLIKLDLIKNKITEVGARALAGYLGTNSTLAVLFLTSNSIGEGGARALAESLKTNTGLQELGLSNNSIGEVGARALAESLKTNTGLQWLDLESNPLGAGEQVLQDVARGRKGFSLYVD